VLAYDFPADVTVVLYYRPAALSLSCTDNCEVEATIPLRAAQPTYPIFPKPPLFSQSNPLAAALDFFI